MEAMDDSTHLEPIPSFPVKRPFYKKKRYLALVLVVIFAIITAVDQLPKSKAESRFGEEATVAFNSLTKDCLDLSKEATTRAVGVNRSSERLRAINSFFVPLVQAKCLSKDGKIYANKYEGLNLNKLENASMFTTEGGLLQGILYDLDYGFSQFTSYGTICADGWISGSVGRGTCSWHGGYAHPRGSEIQFEALNEIVDPENAATPEKYGVSWSLNDPSPVTKAAIKTTGASCIEASGETVQCFAKTQWNRNFCSSSVKANLEIFIEKWWFPVFDTTGKKSARCPSGNPYLIDISGSSLLNASFRLRFPATETEHEFESFFKVVQY